MIFNLRTHQALEPLTASSHCNRLTTKLRMALKKKRGIEAYWSGVKIISGPARGVQWTKLRAPSIIIFSLRYWIRLNSVLEYLVLHIIIILLILPVCSDYFISSNQFTSDSYNAYYRSLLYFLCIFSFIKKW